MAEVNFAHAQATRALCDSLAPLIAVVEVLAELIEDRQQYDWARNTINHARTTLQSGQAAAAAIVTQADLRHYR